MTLSQIDNETVQDTVVDCWEYASRMSETDVVISYYPEPHSQ
jgi:hypothetical protein